MSNGSKSNVDELEFPSIICQRFSDSQVTEYCAAELPMFWADIENATDSPGLAARPEVPAATTLTSSTCPISIVNRCE